MKMCKTHFRSALGVLALWVVATACGTQPAATLAVTPGTRTFAASTCGNGLIEAPEACDDGNLAGGDGCSATCTIESGYSCSGQPSVCETGCGDGVLGDGEQCDDGNTNNADGCTNSCVITAGYTCTDSPSTCAVRCGDGVKAASEACDDGNATNGDGCSSTCAIEPGYRCSDPNVHAIYVRRAKSNCINSDLTRPLLTAGEILPEAVVPGRYRLQYVSGAADYGGGAWHPGIYALNYGSGASLQVKTLGATAYPARTDALSAGFLEQFDFQVSSGDVRLGLVDGNCEDNSNSAVFYRLDAPSTCLLGPVITSPTAGSTTSSTVVVGTGAPGASVDVRVSGGGSACSTTVDAAGNWTCNASGLVDGVITVTATQTLSGTTLTSPPVTFTLDRAAPTRPTITTPPLNSTVATAKPPIGGAAEAGSTVTVREGAAVLCTTTATAQGSWSCVPTQPLAEGLHTVTATAVDAAANASQPSLPDSFTVDTLAPAAPVITRPTAGQVLTDNTPTVGGTAEAGATVRVYVDNGQVPACTATVNAAGTWSCDVSPALADGAHSVKATASDTVGNTSGYSNTVPFVIDTTPPDTFIDTGPAERTTSRTASFSYSSNESNVRYECSLDGADFGLCTNPLSVAVGSHTQRVRAIDAAGNVDPTPAEYPWTVIKSRSLGGGGCSVAPGPLGWSVLALWALRRRARR